MRGHEAAHHDGTGRATPLDLVDAEPNEPVVDQHLVAGLEHVPDHRRRDRELAVSRRLLGADADLVAGVEHHGLRELADAQLGPLQVADERDRAADLGRDLPDEPGPLGVIGMRAMREVEADGVDAGLDERAQPRPRV